MISPSLLSNIGGYVGGRWMQPRDGASLQMTNPATGEVSADVPDMGEAETTEPIDVAAAAAAELERDCPAKQLGHWLSQLRALMMQQQRELARLITLEQGKPLKESFAEVEYAAGLFRLFSEPLARLDSEPLPRRIRNLKWTLHHRPAGRPAKGTPCGLAAYVFSNDPARAGMGRAPEAPFGGAIQSGLGREGAIEELLEFCVTVVGP